MRVIQLPIEPLEERYSSQWRRWFETYWEGETAFVDVPSLTEKIERGAFLDVFGTCFYKSLQMSEMIKMMRLTGFGNSPDDWVLMHDLWSPDLLHLAYVRSCLDLKFRIAGCLHAGTWDPHDFLSKKNVHEWSIPFEYSLFSIANLVFVATEFHKKLICGQSSFNPNDKEKIKVTGFPIYPEEFVPESTERNPHLILFPHRMDPEKQPGKFYALASCFPSLCFQCTVGRSSTKKGYYQILSQAGVALSFALQETWGIAMQEAVFCGAVPFVPDRLSYQEMYPEIFRYQHTEDLISKLDNWMRDSKGCREVYEDARKALAYSLRKAGHRAIPNMVREMRNEH